MPKKRTRAQPVQVLDLKTILQTTVKGLRMRCSNHDLKTNPGMAHQALCDLLVHHARAGNGGRCPCGSVVEGLGLFEVEGAVIQVAVAGAAPPAQVQADLSSVQEQVGGQAAAQPVAGATMAAEAQSQAEGHLAMDVDQPVEAAPIARPDLGKRVAGPLLAEALAEIDALKEQVAVLERERNDALKDSAEAWQSRHDVSDDAIALRAANNEHEADLMMLQRALRKVGQITGQHNVTVEDLAPLTKAISERMGQLATQLAVANAANALDPESAARIEQLERQLREVERERDSIEERRREEILLWQEDREQLHENKLQLCLVRKILDDKLARESDTDKENPRRSEGSTGSRSTAFRPVSRATEALSNELIAAREQIQHLEDQLISREEDVAALQAEVATQNEVIQGLAKNEEKQRVELEKYERMHRETRYRELLSGRDRALARSPSAETNPADDDVSVEVGRGRVEDAGSAGEALSDAAGNSPASYRTEDEVSVSGEQQEVVEEEFVSVDEVQQVGLSPIAEVTEHSGGLRAEGQGFGPITSSSGSYGLASNLRASSLGLADQEEERSKYADLDQSMMFDDEYDEPLYYDNSGSSNAQHSAERSQQESMRSHAANSDEAPPSVVTTTGSIEMGRGPASPLVESRRSWVAAMLDRGSPGTASGRTVPELPTSDPVDDHVPSLLWPDLPQTPPSGRQVWGRLAEGQSPPSGQSESEHMPSDKGSASSRNDTHQGNLGKRRREPDDDDDDVDDVMSAPSKRSRTSNLHAV